MFRTLIAAALIALVFVSAPAFAQSTVIDGGSIFGAWKPYIVEVVGIAVAAIIGLLAAAAKKWLGITIEAGLRDTLQTALTNGAGLALNKIEAATAGMKIDVKNAAVAEAVTYVMKGAPDAIAHFGLTPERLRVMVEAKLGVVKPNA